MPNLEYRREFLKDEEDASKESVYLQLKQSPSREFWIERIRKQDYEEGSNDLADDIFEIDGITELSIQPYRVWFSKSPVFNFEELIGDVLDVLQTNMALDGQEELFGSPIYLTSRKERLDP
jgi:hypothetical protein